MRAVSTVLDVALFLLLVGGAVAAVTAPVPAPTPFDQRHAADTAAVLTTSTASVAYALAPGSETDNPEFDRYAHGTLARLLAAGALGGVTVDGVRISHARDGYRTAVARETEAAVAIPSHGVQVRAVWTPYRGSGIEGRQEVGTEPPADATVQSVTVRVPSGMPSVERTGRARAEGYAGVSRAAARAVVRGLFPPNATRHALADDYPVDTLVRQRYRTAGRLLGAPVTPSKPAAVTDANRRLERRLAGRFERRLRASFDSPERAARALSVGRVRITVRVWST